VRGIQVQEILTAAKSQPHSLTAFAKVDGTQITYPQGGDSDNLKLTFDAP
jgi:hypothetical protein